MEAYLRDVSAAVQRTEAALRRAERSPGVPSGGLRNRMDRLLSWYMLEAGPAVIEARGRQYDARAARQLELAPPIMHECEKVRRDTEKALGTSALELARQCEKAGPAKWGGSAYERGVALMEGRLCPDCFCETDLLPARSETRCPECGRVIEIGGIVFEQSQSYSQDGQKIKVGHFDAVKHMRDWMRSILGNEPLTVLKGKGDEFGIQLIERMKKIRPRYRAYARLLTIRDVRTMLSEIKRTELNPHATLVLVQLGGPAPPSPTEDQMRRGAIIFAKVLEVRETLTLARVNRNYYPYYIYKIFDFILPARDPARRMLEYIHLQGSDTLHKNDAEWREICQRIPGLTWRPTRKI